MTLLRLLFGIAVAHETLYEVTDVTPAAGLMTPDGQHTVWTDKVMVSEPGMHVRYFNVEVHRRIAGGSAQIIVSFENSRLRSRIARLCRPAPRSGPARATVGHPILCPVLPSNTQG